MSDKKPDRKSTTTKPTVRRYKRWGCISLLVIVSAAAFLVALPFWIMGPSGAATPESSGSPLFDLDNTTPGSDSLTLITLNLVHARGEHPFYPYIPRETAEAHLLKIAEVLEREKPDLVALQEADSSSFWNGSFNHARFIAKKARLPFFLTGRQVQGLGLNYGTALISRLPVDQTLTRTFDSALFTLPKGYVKATISWPNESSFKLDVVSVHLDFSRESVRQRQVDEIVDMGFENPVIIMGDFNCEWNDTDSAVQKLAQKLDLIAYQPDKQGLNTYRGSDKRFDWILISSSLRFETHEVVPDILSDHLAVKAIVTRSQEK